MIDRSEIWRRRSWIWWVPLLFVLANVGALLFYRSAYAGKLDVLADRFEDQAEVLDAFRIERSKLEGFLGQVESQKAGTRTLFRDHFATQEERFTEMLREIRTLARRAGLDPSSFAYDAADVKGMDLQRFSVNFSVKGTYDQLRTFINFLELTDQFLALERISLGGGVGDRDVQLDISVEVSTFFADHGAPELMVTEEELRQAQAPPEEGEVLDDAASTGVEGDAEELENAEIVREEEET